MPWSVRLSVLPGLGTQRLAQAYQSCANCGSVRARMKIRRDRHRHIVSPRDNLFPLTITAFSALKLLVGRQEKHWPVKNWLMRCWCGYLPGARCRLFAYDPADATAIPKPHHLLPLKSRLVLSFCYRLTQAVLEKRPLNGCSSSSTTTVTYHYNVQSVENCVADDYKLSMDSKRAATEKFCRNNPKRMYILLTALK